jgi:2,5-dioxopentanoate dehydrogenase
MTAGGLRGSSIVAGEDRAGSGAAFRALDPATGEALDPTYRNAPDAAEEAAAAAAEAFRSLPAGTAPTAGVLRTVADLLEGAAEEVLARCDAETGLGMPRLTGELGRTTGQLRFMAEVAGSGERLDATIDTAVPGAVPPAPDVRRVGLPVGPVAVFGASNFPLAFSVLGGDTASALTAGCPVVVKAHPAHPGTSELCGRLLAEAVRAHGLHPGWSSVVQGADPAVSGALVRAAGVAAVGFTGSIQGGLAIAAIAASRPDPIPVHAEMGSTNPTFVSAAAARHGGAALASALVDSLTMGAGQFCTKPGLVFVAEGADGDAFAADVAREYAARPAGVLLSPTVRDAFARGLAAARSGARVLAAQEDAAGSGLQVAGTLLEVGLDELRASEALRAELFGPAAVVVRCGEEEMAEAAELVEGSLTATVHLHGDADDAWAQQLVAALQLRAGRVVVGGFPTGVRVTRAMHHGGPFPSSTDARHTSVGSGAVDRFLRPVAFQGAPDALLPPALRDANPLGIVRRVDGVLTRDPVTRSG